MAEKLIRNTSHSAQAPGELRINLFDAGMTALHRAGLAGLWVTLQAISERAEHAGLRTTLESLARWTLDRQSVAFAWEDADQATTFFETLIRAAFQVTTDGRIYFLGRGAPQEFRDQGITLHDALLGTFIQHPLTRGIEKGPEPIGVVVVGGDGEEQILRYRKVDWYAHQRAKMKPDGLKAVVSWQYPGASVRHTAFTSDTRLMEPPGPWLALLFAPVGVLYFRVQMWTAGIRPEFSLVVPEIDDLGRYARACLDLRQAGVRDLVVNGSAEAAMRALCALEGSATAREQRVASCHVMSFGNVPWSQQRIRVDLFEAPRITPDRLRIYRKAHQLMPPVSVTPGGGRRAGADGGDEASGRPRYETSPVPELGGTQCRRGTKLVEGFCWNGTQQGRFRADA